MHACVQVGPPHSVSEEARAQEASSRTVNQQRLLQAGCMEALLALGLAAGGAPSVAVRAQVGVGCPAGWVQERAGMCAVRSWVGGWVVVREGAPGMLGSYCGRSDRQAVGRWLS